MSRRVRVQEAHIHPDAVTMLQKGGVDIVVVEWRHEVKEDPDTWCHVISANSEMDTICDGIEGFEKVNPMEEGYSVYLAWMTLDEVKRALGVEG